MTERPNTGMLVPGQRVLVDDEPAEIVAVEADGTIVLAFDEGRPRHFQEQLFNKWRLEGRIQFVPSDHPRKRPSALEALSGPDRVALHRRKKYVERLDLERNPGAEHTRKRVIAEVAEAIGDPHPPGASTLNDWHRDYIRADGHPLSLHYPARDRGNTKARYTPEAERLINTSINEDYLNKRSSMRSAHNRCVQRFRAEGRETERPSYKTYCTRIGKLAEVTVVGRRRGLLAARYVARNQTGTTATTHILERVELDATKLPLLVVDETSTDIVGRPTLFVIKDRHSGALLGYHYTFGGESAVAVIETLRQAILPKDAFHKRHPGVRNHWRMQGLPLELVMDAGAGMQSHDLDQMCLNLGIHVNTNPVAQPWNKGAVESIIEELNQICVELPGGVHSDLRPLPSDYDAVKNACITISRFDDIIARAVVDIVNQRPSENDSLSPDERWQQGEEAAPPRQPAHLPDLFAYGTKRIYRPIHRHKGFTYQRGWWNSDQLQRLREDLGPKQQLQIRINPNGIDTAYVVNPLTNHFMEVPLVTPHYAGLTLDELHKLRKVVRDRYNRHESHEALRLARDDIDHMVAASRAEAKARDRSRRHAKRDNQGPAFPLDPDQQGGISDDSVWRGEEAWTPIA